MKVYTSILFLIITYFTFAQSPADSVSIQMKIYNPLDTALTITIKNPPNSKRLSTYEILKIPAGDTVTFPFEIELADNQVPTRYYDIRVYEAPDYYEITYHDYWDCVRLVGECYSCIHVIRTEINLVDSMRFDSAQFLVDKRNQEPIYDILQSGNEPVYIDGIDSLMSRSRTALLQAGATESITIYVQVVVEIDGTTSNVKILKSPNEKYNQAVLDFFEAAIFHPGIRNGRSVRTKMNFPISVRF